jgi:hypothetical protein
MILFTLPEAIPLSRGVQRVALLPARPFVKGGEQITVTREILDAMVALTRSGLLGTRCMVTLAHPEDPSSAPAYGWQLCHTAAVDMIGDEPAYAVDIEWMPVCKDDIGTSWGYVSPCFTFDYVDQYGQHRGPAMLQAGLTNTPHWTDQPGLWATFTARINNDGESRNTKEATMAGMDPAAAAKLMEELQAKQAEYDTLKAQYEESEKVLADLKAKLAEATGQAVAATEQAAAQGAEMKAVMSALQDRLTTLEGENKAIKGKAMIDKFTAEGLQHKYLFTPDGKPTKLHGLAITNSDLFVELATNMLPEHPHQTMPVGSNSVNAQFSSDNTSDGDRVVAEAKQIQEKAKADGKPINFKAAVHLVRSAKKGA